MTRVVEVVQPAPVVVDVVQPPPVVVEVTAGLRGPRGEPGADSTVPGPPGLNGTGLLVGSGMPEGVVTAPVGTVYSDTAATNGATLWRKATGSGNTGWVVLRGYTARQVSTLLVNGWAQISAGTWGTYLIRENNRCTLTAYLNPAAATANVFLIPPAGFTPSLVAFGTANIVGAGGTWAVRALSAGLDLPYRTSMAGASSFVNLSWVTNDPWPTTLPGTAV